MRAHLFQGADYYPSYGTGDYTQSFDDPEEARQFALDNPVSDWYCVVTDDGDTLSEYTSGYYR